jgi:hypothetical protein
MAQSALRGGTYSETAVRAMIAETSPTDCRAEVRSSVLVLELRLFDVQSRQGAILRMGADDTIWATRRAAQALLDCAPSSSLGWFALYLTTIRLNGFGERALAELNESYRNAPHEAWLQALRLPTVLTGIAAMPEPLRQAAQRDFDDLLQANMLNAIATLLVSHRLPPPFLDTLCGESLLKRSYIGQRMLQLNSEPRIRCLAETLRPAHLR